LEGTLGLVDVPRPSLNLTSWDAAEEYVRESNRTGKVGGTTMKPMLTADAVELYLTDVVKAREDKLEEAVRRTWKSDSIASRPKRRGKVSFAAARVSCIQRPSTPLRRMLQSDACPLNRRVEFSKYRRMLIWSSHR
jgi:hypothetical protein